MVPSMDTTANVYLHPAAAELVQRRDRLRSDLAALLERVDRCVFVDIPFVVALYDGKLGGLECELLKLRAGNASLRRRIELVVARRNHGEAITAQTLAAIDEQVAEELASWWKEVHQREREVRERRAWMEGSAPGDPAVVAEVRKLYRALCRRLHPDATGGETEAHTRHWTTVQAAYRELDVEVLRALHSILLDEAGSAAPDALDEIQAQCARLEQRIRAQADRLEALRKNPPLCHLAFLEDPAQVAGKQAEARVAVASERARRSELEAALAAVGGTPWARA
jgi:hypothetical protein